MATNSLSKPERCETCKKIGTENCPYDTELSNQDNCDYVSQFRRDVPILSLTEISDLCGLSCHTNTQNNIDNIINIIKEHEYDLSDGYCYYGGDKSIRKLALDINTFLQEHKSINEKLNEPDLIISRLNNIRDMVDDTKDLSDSYRVKGISSCVHSELSDIMKEIDNLSKEISDSHKTQFIDTRTALEEIEYGITAYEKEHEHMQVCDNNGMYIPTNVVRQLIQVRKDRSSNSVTNQRIEMLSDIVNSKNILNAPNDIRIPLQQNLKSAIWYLKKIAILQENNQK